MLLTEPQVDMDIKPRLCCHHWLLNHQGLSIGHQQGHLGFLGYLDLDSLGYLGYLDSLDSLDSLGFLGYLDHLDYHGPPPPWRPDHFPGRGWKAKLLKVQRGQAIFNIHGNKAFLETVTLELHVKMCERNLDTDSVWSSGRDKRFLQREYLILWKKWKTFYWNIEKTWLNQPNKDMFSLAMILMCAFPGIQLWERIETEGISTIHRPHRTSQTSQTSH